MTRLVKILGVFGLASVYLMQVPCTFGPHGFNMIPNGLIPNPFAAINPLLAGLTGT